MADYKETTATSKSWWRCRHINISNPSDGLKIATFVEEEVVQVGDRLIGRDVGTCQALFNPETTVELRNPETNEPLGTSVTHAELYVMLYSLYIQTATARDAAQ